MSVSEILPSPKARDLYLFSAAADWEAARDEVRRTLDDGYTDRLSGLYGMAVEVEAGNTGRFEQGRLAVANFDRVRAAGEPSGPSDRFWTVCAGVSQKTWATKLPLLTALVAEWEANAVDKLAVVGSPAMREFERKTRLYRRGLTQWRDHLRELFPGPRDFPSAVVTYNEAVRFERTLDYAAANTERHTLIELLTQKLDKQGLLQLIHITQESLDSAALVQDFYLGMKALVDKTDIDMRSFPATADYFRYCELALRARPKTMLTLIWDTHVATYSELVKSPVDARAVRDLLEAYLATRALAYSSRHLELARYGGERRTVPSPPVRSGASRNRRLGLLALLVLALAVIAAVVWLAGPYRP